MSIMDLMTTKTITRICWIIINLSCLGTGLKDVVVTVPAIVRPGENVLLKCSYDLETSNLYTIRWYKGRREFYRYSPNDDPSIKVWPMSSIVVDRSMSNGSNVMLASVVPSASGKYSCEVSADAPTFDTAIVSADLEVVDFPSIRPTIEGVDNLYSIGNILTANCTSNGSKSVTNLTWIINNYTAPSSEIVEYKIPKDELNQGESLLGLRLILTPKYFRSKTLRLACRARIYEIYDEIAERIIELDASTANQILEDDFNTIRSNKHSQFETEIDEGHDFLMHQIQADMSSRGNTAIERISFVLKYTVISLMIMIQTIMKVIYNF